MTTADLYIEKQYQLVLTSRRIMFRYVEQLGEDVFSRLDTFTNKSVSDQLLHVSDVYKFWLGQFAMQQRVQYSAPENTASLLQIHQLFDIVDSIMHDFQEHYRGRWETLVSGSINNASAKVERSAFEIFTHVIMHEFHHKGQILIMGRQLGIIPPDTDIIHF